VLTSILTLALFSTFRTGVKTWRTAEDHAERVGNARQLLNVLHRHLFQAAPLMLASQSGAEFSFSGGISSIRYVSPLSMSTAGELYVVELFSGRDAAPGLWGRFAPYVADADFEQALEQATPALIGENIDVTFAYYGPLEGGGAGMDWQEGWVDRTSFPLLVRVEVHSPDLSLPAVVLRVGSG